MGINTETQLDNMQRVRDFRALCINEMTYQTPPVNVQGSILKRRWRDFNIQKWRMTPRKWCIPNMAGMMHI